jgi:uncharacterized protein
MKLYRSELLEGIDSRLFEDAVEQIISDDFVFFKDTIETTISSEKVNNGFRIKGNIAIPFLETCDRCLTKFEKLTETNFEIWLYSDAPLIEESNQDAIYFPESMDVIDLSEVIEEFIGLEEPIKRLCFDECKGLCFTCGINLNEENCDCNSTAANNTWETRVKHTF